MTFGLYLHRDLREDFQIAFLRAFVSDYNLCRQRFENGGVYRKQLLRKMSQVTGFLNNYGFGIFSEISPDGIRCG